MTSGTTSPHVSTNGFHIALLGIDGIGKSTVARSLQGTFQAAGFTVEPIAWRSEVTSSTSSATHTALRELWVESLRLLLLRDDVAEQVPATFDLLMAGATEAQVFARGQLASKASGLLAATYVELAGQVLLHDDIIGGARSRGSVVIEESAGIKLVAKLLMIIELISDSEALREEAAALLKFLPTLLRRRRPDLGIVVSGAVELAFARRVRDESGIGFLEQLPLKGATPLERFARLQTPLDEYFRRFGRAEGWAVFEMKDESPEESLQGLLDLVGASLPFS